VDGHDASAKADWLKAASLAESRLSAMERELAELVNDNPKRRLDRVREVRRAIGDMRQDVTRRVAAEGYVALAPDFFHRTGAGLSLGYDDAGFEEGFKHLNQLQADQMIADAKDAVAYLKGRDDTTDKVGVMGFCIGGHMTYLTACETDVAAAASYYGGGIAAPEGPGGGPGTLTRTGKIGGRIHCYFGSKDALIPADQVEAVKASLAENGIDHAIEIYDADHGFHCDQRGTYHETSAKDAWEKTKALFASTLRD